MTRLMAILCFSITTISAGCGGNDDKCGTTYYADSDGDGYGDPIVTMEACETPAGYVANADDCDDTKNSINPDASEVCDGVDNNCNTLIDSDDPDNDPDTQRDYYRDNDGDGYGVDGDTQYSCDMPDGYANEPGDCDDSEASINPGAIEQCGDQVDNDCDNLTDLDDDSLPADQIAQLHRDADGDGYGRQQQETVCAGAAGYVSNGDDCDDNRSLINPAADEECDNRDNNCNGLTDAEDPTIAPALLTEFFVDSDGDGYGTGQGVLECFAPNMHVNANGDCDDQNTAANPGQTEICDGIDNDCDGGNDNSVMGVSICPVADGTYEGDFLLDSEQRSGNIVLNEHRCTGTSTVNITVDLSQSPALQGTATCTKDFGPTIWEDSQSSTFSGDVLPDGTLQGTITHNYDWFDSFTFDFSGTLQGDDLHITSMGAYYFHPMQVVPDTIDITITSTRQP